MTVKASPIQKWLELPKKLSARVKQRGIVNALDWCWYQMQWRVREWRLGTNTREFAHGVIVGDKEERNGYEPIDYRCFDEILSYLQPIDSRLGFLDYGCGMGRAVIQAATQPFGAVLGLEYDTRLASLARKQLETVTRRKAVRARHVEIVEGDAAEFEVPATINVIYLFNSFTGSLLQRTLEQVRKSLERHPRQLKLIYTQPIHDVNLLEYVDWLRFETNVSTGFWDHVRTQVYVADFVSKGAVT